MPKKQITISVSYEWTGNTAPPEAWLASAIISKIGNGLFTEDFDRRYQAELIEKQRNAVISGEPAPARLDWWDEQFVAIRARVEHN